MSEHVEAAEQRHVFPEDDLPRTYLEAVERVAAKHGYRIEPRGRRLYLRPLEDTSVIRLRAPKSTETPTNHLCYFNSLGEIHSFLTG